MEIPNKSRPEWRQLLDGTLDVKFDNFVLQMKVDQTKRAIKNAKITIDEGVDLIHSLCEKYVKAVQRDLSKIFK